MPWIEVCWGSGKCDRFEWQAEFNVAEFVELIQDQILGQLAANPSFGFETVEYGLFRRSGESLTRLERRMPLRNLLLQPDERLYFANVLNPWWLITQEHCEVEITAGHAVPVPGQGLMLSRAYLLGQLPSHIAEEQRKIYRETRDSPLSRVSRDRHCEILFENGWYLRCYNTVSVDGVELPNPALYPLDYEGSRTIILGSAGWPVTIRISRRQQQLPISEL